MCKIMVLLPLKGKIKHKERCFHTTTRDTLANIILSKCVFLHSNKMLIHNVCL